MRFIQWIKSLFARRATAQSRIDMEDLQRGSDFDKFDDMPAVSRKSNARYIHTVEGDKPMRKMREHCLAVPKAPDLRNFDQCNRLARARCGGQRIHCTVCGYRECPRTRIEQKAQQSWIQNPPPAPASMQSSASADDTDRFVNMLRAFTHSEPQTDTQSPRFASGGGGDYGGGGASGSWGSDSSSSDSSSCDSSSSGDGDSSSGN